jgi:hypothetical protein
MVDGNYFARNSTTEQKSGGGKNISLGPKATYGPSVDRNPTKLSKSDFCNLGENRTGGSFKLFAVDVSRIAVNHLKWGELKLQ